MEAASFAARPLTLPVAMESKPCQASLWKITSSG